MFVPEKVRYDGRVWRKFCRFTRVTDGACNDDEMPPGSLLLTARLEQVPAVSRLNELLVMLLFRIACKKIEQHHLISIANHIKMTSQGFILMKKTYI